MKKILPFLLLVLIGSFCSAQSPIYYFTKAIDSAIESNATIVASYIKTNTPPTTLDSVLVILKSGSPRSTHMDTTSVYKVYFAAGQDSVPFPIQIMKDTFPEYPEHVLYELRSASHNSDIAADSFLLFTLIDTTPPAIIGFIMDSAYGWEDIDSFSNGSYVVYNSQYGIGIRVNNPNPFYVRYYADNISCGTYDHWVLNACYLQDFFFNGETCYAPPGVSTYYKTLYITDGDFDTVNKYFLCRVSNFDANFIADSFELFRIQPVNFYNPPHISFDTPATTIIGNLSQKIGIPITINNTNRRPLYFHVDTTQTSSSFPGIDYTLGQQNFGYGYGITYDTIWVNLIDRGLINDTIKATFVIRGDSLNPAADTLFNLTIIDTGSLVLSFKGAGFSHLKSDSIGYIQVYTSAPVNYPISVDVSFLNGSAIRDTDFIFNDTTLIFPANNYDTISLPVIMLQDHIHSGNTQLNLGLTNVNPSSVKYDISEYSYTIIDNEDSNLAPLGIKGENNTSPIKIYPTPFDNQINIQTSISNYSIRIINSLGEIIYNLSEQTGTIKLNMEQQIPGIYLIEIANDSYTYINKILKL